VLGLDALVVEPDRNGLRRLQEALGAIGELFEIHGLVFPPDRSDMVLHFCNTRGLSSFS
jgi:hypothetical protein